MFFYNVNDINFIEFNNGFVPTPANPHNVTGLSISCPLKRAITVPLVMQPRRPRGK